MKKLLTLGDSFTYGDELKNRSDAWPYLLADKLGYEVVNLGYCGGSNHRMVRMMLTEDITDFDLVVLAWTGFDRIEMADEYSTWEYWLGCHSNSYRVPVKEVKWRKGVIDYLNRHHNEEYLYRQYLGYCILAQSYLKLHNVPYIMLDAFINHEMPNRMSESNIDLVKKIDTSRYLGWPNESMKEWASNVPYGPHKHFLEEGHQIVAEKIYNFLT
jgi:hypothetical protein